jgi:murein DD-endopeptidase MepM/ murein hydrolase activator NlpD
VQESSNRCGERAGEAVKPLTAVVVVLLVLLKLYQLGSTPPAAPAPAVAPIVSGDPRTSWAIDLAQRLGNPAPDAATVGFIVAWSNAEDRSDEAIGRFNPLNTTETGGAVQTINSDGVRGYGSYEDGMQATIQTLSYDHPGYAEIVAGIQTNDPERALRGLYASPWGTSAATTEAIWRSEPIAVEQPAPVATGAKYQVTPTMEIGAHFDTVDCGSWGFQTGCQHWGTDYLAPEGTPVTTPFDLTIIALGEYPPGPTEGQYVQGTFSDGYVFYSGHLERRPDVAVGQTLPAGTLIGYTNSLNHTHIQLGPPGNSGACAQDGSCVDFERYYEEH